MDKRLIRGEEELKEENDFLKMKLMLERGAQFGAEASEAISPRMENDFLHYIQEFERQSEGASQISIFEKVGSPTHFPSVAEIPEAEMGRAWRELNAYLCEHGISLSACSPNVQPKELYRFTVEELFLLEVDDIRMPGMMHGFIYDEFYPDVRYENARMAVEYCMKVIFSPAPVEWMPFLRESGLRLNGRGSLTEDQFKARINRFKMLYDELSIERLEHTNCTVGDEDSSVMGRYKLSVRCGKDVFPLVGGWRVDFEKREDDNVWMVKGVEVEGIEI